jgi:hypothetical protein
MLVIQTEGNVEMDTKKLSTGYSNSTGGGLTGESGRHHIGGWLQPEFQTERRKCLQNRYECYSEYYFTWGRRCEAPRGRGLFHGKLLWFTSPYPMLLLTGYRFLVNSMRASGFVWHHVFRHTVTNSGVSGSRVTSLLYQALGKTFHDQVKWVTLRNRWLVDPGRWRKLVPTLRWL